MSQCSSNKTTLVFLIAIQQVKSQCSSLSDRDEEVFDGHGEIDDGSGYYDDR